MRCEGVRVVRRWGLGGGLVRETLRGCLGRGAALEEEVGIK